jgi:thioredoxin-related protein
MQRDCLLRLLLGLMLCLGSADRAVLAAGDVIAEVPPAADFSADAKEAAKEGIPILVVVTRNGCSYCATIKHKILLPMQRNEKYRRQIIMRELNVDGLALITDFSGERVSRLNWAKHYRAAITPTVLLLDPDGHEAAERLLGISTVEMYGWYLDRSIATATANIRSLGDPAPATN